MPGFLDHHVRRPVTVSRADIGLFQAAHIVALVPVQHMMV